MSDAPTVTRVVTLPIRSVVEPPGLSVLDTFRASWQMATDLANWAIRELALRDARRTPGMASYPAYDRAAMFGTHPRRFARKAKGDAKAAAVGDPRVGDLYDLWNREYPAALRVAWDDMAVVARDVLTNVERTWRTHKSYGRFAVNWKGSASPSTYKFPYPWPVASDKGRTLRISRDPDGVPCASIPLSGERVTVRLAHGREYRRQTAQFDWLLAHIDRLRQGKVCPIKRGGRLIGACLRLVGTFDAADAPGGLTATVRTGSGGLITAVVEGDDGNPFVYHGDELAGLIALHDDWSHRFAVDMRHEKQWPAQVRRRRFDGPRVQARRDKLRNRLRTARQTAAAQLVGWLTRRKVGCVLYDDSDKSFLPRFDWTGLREVVRFKCQEAGVEFQVQRGGDDVAE